MLKLIKEYKKGNYWKDMLLYQDDVTGIRECFHRFDVDTMPFQTVRDFSGGRNLSYKYWTDEEKEKIKNELSSGSSRAEVIKKMCSQFERHTNKSIITKVHEISRRLENEQTTTQTSNS